MNQRLITEIGRSQRLQIINELKCTEGMSVRELAAALNMSYMGIKQHCIELERSGYLDHWRRPKAVGRPEMLYRLTRRTEELFPATNNTMALELMEMSAKLFGPQSPEKLLFLVFQSRADFYRANLKGQTLEERATSLAKIRDNEGHMARFENGTEGMVISEHHSPILELARKYPNIGRLEEKMFESVLEVPVRRQERTKSGLYACRFWIG